MPKTVKPYEGPDSKKTQVTQMFDNISGEYDSLNRVISFGIDLRWRKKVVSYFKDIESGMLLDVATGTGDLAIALAKTPVDKVVGLDLSAGMLNIGQLKIKQHQLGHKIDMVLGDGEKIPFDNNTFEGATIAFGVRNFENLDAGLQEVLRVLKSGAKLVILETSVPTNPVLRFGYFMHTRVLLPLIGKCFSKDKKAYGYLSESAAHFPFGERFCNILIKNGFIEVDHHPQTGGAATIYEAKKA